MTTNIEHAQNILSSSSWLLVYFYHIQSIDISFLTSIRMGRITWHTSLTGIVFGVTILLTWFCTDSILGWHNTKRLVFIDPFIHLYSNISNVLICSSVLQCRTLPQVVMGLQRQVYHYHMVCLYHYVSFVYGWLIPLHYRE